MGHQSKTNYFSKLKYISREDLKYVEKDLAFYEKVSIAFLLFGGTQANGLFALQKLLVLANSDDRDSDILFSYAGTTPEWKLPLLEALSIIKANRILRKLGFDQTELRTVFLPHIPSVTLNIHPIIKTLYIICENLTPSEAGNLVLRINQNTNPSNHLRFYNSMYLEIFLLDWITKSVIFVGEWPQTKSDRAPNLDLIVEYLKDSKKYSLNNVLVDTLNSFMSKTDPTPKPTSTKSNRNENDGVMQRNTSFERKESYPICDNDRYLIRKESAGFILIINEMQFHRSNNPELQDLLPKENLKERLGSDKDVTSLKETFASFGYTPIIKNNLEHYKILSTIDDFVKKTAAFDSLIVCILSHGAEGVVYGSDSIPVNITKIEKLLTADSLLGKPKILVVQACQGATYQEAKKISNWETDAPDTTAAAYSDMLVAMSTVAGFASVRHKERGTWFLQALCKNVDKMGDTAHILDILRVTNREVQSKRGYDNQCMVPKIISTMIKHYFLPRRY